MAQQTFVIGDAVNVRNIFAQWQRDDNDAVLINQDLIVGNIAAYFRLIRLGRGTGSTNNLFYVSVDGVVAPSLIGPEMIAAWENFSGAMILSAGSLSITIKGPNHPDNIDQDSSEPYSWEVSTADKILQTNFVTAYLNLSQIERDATNLTIYDGIPEPVILTGQTSQVNFQSQQATLKVRPAILLSDFDATGFVVEALAIIEVEVNGQYIFALNISQSDDTGSIIAGELQLSAGPLIGGFQRSSNLMIRLRKSNAPSFSDWFNTNHPNATIYIQPEKDSNSRFELIKGNQGGGFSNWDIAQANQDIISNFVDGQRFLFAIVEPDVAVILRGQTSQVSFESSQARLAVLDRAILRGQTSQVSFESSQARLNIQFPIDDIITTIGKEAPRIQSKSILRKSLQSIIASVSTNNDFPIYCPSKRVLIGTKVFPFAGMDYIGNFRLTDATWTVRNLDTNRFAIEQQIVLGDYTDLLAAIRFFSVTLTSFGVYIYKLSVISEFNTTADIIVDVVCAISPGADKTVAPNVPIKPFADFQIAYDVSQIQLLQHEAIGDHPTALASIDREIKFQGRHEILPNSQILFDGMNHYTPADVIEGQDIIENITDGSSGIVDKILHEGHGISITNLSGGVNNNFQPKDQYRIREGRYWDSIASAFELTYNLIGTNLIRLHVTDNQNRKSIASTLVRIR